MMEKFESNNERKTVINRILMFLILIMPLTAFGKSMLVVDAGSDQSVMQDDLVLLQGKGVFKNKGLAKTKTITYSWEQTAGTLVDLVDSDMANVSFTAPKPDGTEETLNFKLTASSSIGNCKGKGKSKGKGKGKGKGKCKTVSDTDEVSVLVIGIPTSSSINGRVVDVAGNVIPDVNVDVLLDGSSQLVDMTDASGHFELNVPDGIEYVLKLTASGYAVQSTPVKSPAADGTVSIDVTMIARSEPQVFDSGSAAALSGTAGASVNIAANSFVDTDGNPVTGDIQVSITPVDISHPASLAAFPGEFSGVLEGTTEESPIISFGTVEFVFTQNGQPVQLAEGQSADIEIPIYTNTYQDGTTIIVGDEIPLWSLNENTGIWTQEGTGTVVDSTDSSTGLAMAATVNHFTWWNCDVSMNSAQAIVTVVGTDSGTALVKARTIADIGGWRPNTVETVIDLGVATSPLYIPSNGEVCFWAEISYSNGSIGSTDEQCVNASANSVIDLILTEPVPGPLSIRTIPEYTNSVLDISGFINFPAVPVKLLSATFETAVNYNIVSGALPAGLSLNSVNASRAEITGIPTEAGNFSVVVQGTDAENDTDMVTINYSVSASVPPPVLNQRIRIDYNRDNNVFDLMDFNTGGAVTNWSLSTSPLLSFSRVAAVDAIVVEDPDVPSALNLDPVAGILTITSECVFWNGELTASNDSGSSTASISVGDVFCQ